MYRRAACLLAGPFRSTGITFSSHRKTLQHHHSIVSHHKVELPSRTDAHAASEHHEHKRRLSTRKLSALSGPPTTPIPSIIANSQPASAATSAFSAGFYVACHPWLAEHGFVKVGFSAHVVDRLNENAYVTCLTAGWTFLGILAVHNVQDARLVETLVLRSFASVREPNKELLRVDVSAIREAVRMICEEFGLLCDWREPHATAYRPPPWLASGRAASEAQQRRGQIMARFPGLCSAPCRKAKGRTRVTKRTDDRVRSQSVVERVQAFVMGNQNSLHKSSAAVLQRAIQRSNQQRQQQSLCSRVRDGTFGSAFSGKRGAGGGDVPAADRVQDDQVPVPTSLDDSRSVATIDTTPPQLTTTTLPPSVAGSEDESSPFAVGIYTACDGMIAVEVGDPLHVAQRLRNVPPIGWSVAGMGVTVGHREARALESLVAEWNRQRRGSNELGGDVRNVTAIVETLCAQHGINFQWQHPATLLAETAPDLDARLTKKPDDDVAGGVEEDTDEMDQLSAAEDQLIADVEEQVQHEAAVGSSFTLRDYQVQAATRVLSELNTAANQRCILQMACRCGKTPVAYEVAATLVDQLDPSALPPGVRRLTLYLVPGLALLRQTAVKLTRYDAARGIANRPLLLLGSDLRAVQLSQDQRMYMSMSAEEVRQFLTAADNAPPGTPAPIILSTYQSSHHVDRDIHPSLTIFDEVHRTCGSIMPSAFNDVLMRPAVPGARRMFMTATPSYDTPVSMSDTNLFGGVASRYYLREGIDAGHVNPFQLRIVLDEADAAAMSAVDMSKQTKKKTARADVARAFFGPRLGIGMVSLAEAMAPHIVEAMKRVDKLLVFCRNIAHAEALHDAVVRIAKPADLAPFECALAHSRLPLGGAAAALQLMCDPNIKRVALFNCRLFQEGVEIPELTGVFFAAPRYSPRDIIQSLCRPLSKSPNKPPSIVFLPALVAAGRRPDDPVNLESFSTFVPFFEALTDEDPKLFEWLLNPTLHSYDVDVIGVRKNLNLTALRGHKRDVLLSALRRGVRYTNKQSDRFARASRLPWVAAFAQLKAIVTTARRYPKHNDAWSVGEGTVALYNFYRYCRENYEAFQQHGLSATVLQPHQLHDLETLPEWPTRGIQGPYPWDECLETLRQYLQDNKGRPPPLDINIGGYTGLNATPLERLSGLLCTVNQQDGRRGFHFSAEKQQKLSGVCEPFGLRWRKPRDDRGKLLDKEAEGFGTTFIQDLNQDFKKKYAAAVADPTTPDSMEFLAFVKRHFPGYPVKHQLQEDLDVLRANRVPPRLAMRTRAVDEGEMNGTTTEADGADAADAAPSADAADSEEGASTSKRRSRKKRHDGIRVSDPRQHAVCRICRAIVHIHEWDAHSQTETHLKILKEFAATLDADVPRRATVRVLRSKHRKPRPIIAEGDERATEP
jgi:superfamily II DNA or RNA helicase